MITTPSFPVFSVVFINQKHIKCSCTVDFGFVKFSLDCFCGNRVFKMNIEFRCHLSCSWSMILDTILFNLRQSLHLVLVFAHYFS